MATLAKCANAPWRLLSAFVPMLAGTPEVHHIKPLGSGHQGPDYPGNMLVLCPNHHAAFDLSTMALDPETLEVYDLEADRELHNKGPIFLHESGHDFDSECLRYA